MGSLETGPQGLPCATWLRVTFALHHLLPGACLKYATESQNCWGLGSFQLLALFCPRVCKPWGPTAAQPPCICISLWLDAMRVVDHCGLRLGFKPTVQGPLASSPDGFPVALLALPLQPGAGRACHSVEPLAHTSSLGNSLKPQQGGTAEARRARWVKPTAAAHAHRKCAGAGIQWRGLGSGQCLGRLWVGGGTSVRKNQRRRNGAARGASRPAGARAGWQQQQQQQGGRRQPSQRNCGRRALGGSVNSYHGALARTKRRAEGRPRQKVIRDEIPA